MKTSVLVTVLLSFAMITQAQIRKGNVLVGGDLANWDLSLNKGGNFSVDIVPKIGWFVKTNTVIGPYVMLNLATAKDEGTSIGYGVGAFARYYLAPGTITKDEAFVRRTRFFAEANAGIEGYNPAAGDNTNGLGLGIGPGLAYFITPNIALEALLKYRNIVGFGSTPSSSNLNFNLGFQIYLSGRTAQRIIDETK